MIEKIFNKLGYVKKDELDKRANECLETIEEIRKSFGEAYSEACNDFTDKENLLQLEKKRLEDKSKELKKEITYLRNELSLLHEKYDGKFIVEKLPPVKLNKSQRQTMKVSSRHAVRSRIARNSAEDLESKGE